VLDIMSTPSPTAPRSVDRLLDQLDMEAAVGCGWWETYTAAVMTGLVLAGPAVVVFTVIAQLLRDGEDPDVIVGDTTAGAAFAVAQEWIDADIDPGDVQGWLRSGCWKPTVASALADVGLQPRHLLGDDGRPQHWIDVPTPDGDPVPLARAVVEEFLSVEAAVAIAARGTT
jgi:hypothetical protein